MANAKRCDRCGKFYSEKDKEFKINKNDKHIPSWIEIINTNDMAICAYDLCEQCMKDLYRWLCNEQESEENE